MTTTRADSQTLINPVAVTHNNVSVVEYYVARRLVAIYYLSLNSFIFIRIVMTFVFY